MSDVSFSLERALSSPETRRRLERFVRRRVPSAEVDDIVQTVLTDALAAPSPPPDDPTFRRWVIGVARHKVADHHRKQHRRPPAVALGEEHIEGARPAIDARDLSRWAVRQASDDEDAVRTLEWMAREGAGEKLAHIAADEALPATMVRQRVSRLRRFMRERWREELAAVALVTGLFLWWQTRTPEPVPTVRPAPELVIPEVSPRPPDDEVFPGPPDVGPPEPIPSVRPAEGPPVAPSATASVAPPTSVPVVPKSPPVERPAPKEEPTKSEPAPTKTPPFDLNPTKSRDGASSSSSTSPSPSDTRSLLDRKKRKKKKMK
ncbi:MAG: sigma factor [Myxococcota bacterium]